MAGHGRMSDAQAGDTENLVQALLQQQTALLHAHTESLRLQRLLVEQLLAVERRVPPVGTPEPVKPVRAENEPAQHAPAPSASSPAQASTQPDTDSPIAVRDIVADTAGRVPAEPVAATSAGASRGARYYQVGSSSPVARVQPQDLELMRRLQEVRDASSLILQFGPFKGTTMAQVALDNPDYVRRLMTGARRPEVRAAAGRLVEALDAASEHRSRRPRSTRAHA
jgi:hypothetical protein